MSSTSSTSTVSEIRDEVVGKLVLGRYRVVRQLARGGMGVVYLGRIEGAAGFAKPVVVKRISPDMHTLKESRSLFVREARILSNLQHSGTVAVLDFGEEQGAYVMVLEYVHGYDVAQWLKYWRKLERVMPVEYAVYIIARVLDALHYAHTLKRPDGTPFGIVHRDVSPGNVLIDIQGNVKLLDFGIARTTEDTGEFRTQDGSFKGKLAFVAPEVYHGRTASVSSDVYSCGVLLYQLLTGENPFSGGALTETVRRVLTHTPSPISARRDDLPDELDEIVMKAMDKEPAERFANAAEFASALRALSTVSESEAAADFAASIHRDFTGEMPATLNLESLDIRDSAWRDAQEGPPEERVPLTSSNPPAIRTSHHDEPTRLAAPRAAPLPRIIEATPRSRGRLGLLLVIGVVGALATALIVLLIERETPVREPRFVVVERPTPEPTDPEPQVAAHSEPGATGIASDSAPFVAAPLASGAGSPALVRPAPAGSPPKPDPQALSRTFGNKRGLIEACFRREAEQVQGRPQLAVRFTVGRSGLVQDAQLIPQGLAGTQLGQCVLSVARGTNFGPQTEEITFSIPITARKLE